MERNRRRRPGPRCRHTLGQEFASLAPELSRRIGAILDTIQREADKMLDQARLEAQRRVEDGRREADELISERRLRLARLSDDLIARSEQVLAAARRDRAGPPELRAAV